jgi:hypothetical protein
MLITDTPRMSRLLNFTRDNSTSTAAMALNSSKRSFETFAGPNGTISSVQTDVPALKKARADNNVNLWEMITKLDATTTRSLLHHFCTQDPSLAAHVESAHRSRLAKEATKAPVEFDRYSKSCWHALNSQYRGMRSSKQFEAMGDIIGTLDSSRRAIMKAATPDTRFETRRNALEVLRKISKSVMLCDEQQIRHEIMKDGMTLGEFADSMVELAGGMTVEEREKYKKEGLYEKLVDLQNECDDVDMEGLQEVYAIFYGEGDEEEDGDENEDGSGSESSDAPEFLESRPKQPPPPQRTQVFSVGELS